MHINISGHHLELTDGLRQHINEKFKKLENHEHQITNISITLTVENKRKKSEANIHVSGMDVFASANSDDMYSSIDKLVNKLDSQLLKHKEKLKNRQRDSSLSDKQNEAAEV